VTEPTFLTALAIVFLGAPISVSMVLSPSIRSAIARRLGGRTAEDEALVVELKLRLEALEREFDALAQTNGLPARLPPHPSTPPGHSVPR
jgi:hypothetical protein